MAVGLVHRVQETRIGRKVCEILQVSISELMLYQHTVYGFMKSKRDVFGCHVLKCFRYVHNIYVVNIFDYDIFKPSMVGLAPIGQARTKAHPYNSVQVSSMWLRSIGIRTRGEARHIIKFSSYFT